MGQLTEGLQARGTLQETIVEAATARLPMLMRPILGFRRTYLPLLTIYFAYGALGLIERQPRYVDQGASDSDPGRDRRNRRLA